MTTGLTVQIIMMGIAIHGLGIIAPIETTEVTAATETIEGIGTIAGIAIHAVALSIERLIRHAMTHASFWLKKFIIPAAVANNMYVRSS